MKLFLQGFCLLTVAALVVVSPVARAQRIEGAVKGFKHSFVDEKTGRRTMLLSGGSATNISNEQLLIGDGVRLQFFDDTGKTNLEVASAACVYNLATESVTSSNRLQAGSGNGQFSLEGEGFEYARTNGSLTISNHVHAIIRKDLLQPPSQMPAARSAAQAGTQTDAAPVTNQFLHIFSDRMRYQTNLAVFEDKVRVEESQGDVACGSLTVTFSDSSQTDERRRIEKIVAKQHVVIDSEEIHATGEEATYRLASDAVELTGKPAWRLRQYEGRAQSLAVNRMAHEFHAIGDVEMKLPAGSIGRNGFLLPESSPATNAALATAQPVLVRADDFQFRPDVANTNFNVAVFRNHVQATGAKGSLSCELMTIQSTAQSNRTESVVAERNVVMAQGERRVTGEKAVYTAAADTVEVTGHPAWKMGQHEGTAEVLAFNLKGDSYRATRRVEMRLPPASFGRTPWLLAKSGVLTNSSTGAGGATTPRPAQPIEISCDEFELTPDAANTNLNLAIYRGQVRVRDVDRMKLSCEFLAVRGRMLPGTNQVEKVVAEGNVDLEVHESRGERRAQGDKAIYTAADGEVELSGNGGVKIAFVDSKIEGSAMGAKAVYAGGQDVLELTGNSVLGNPVLRTQDGQVWGEVLVLDHANTTLRATGRWKMKLKPESLKKTAAPAAPKSGS